MILDCVNLCQSGCFASSAGLEAAGIRKEGQDSKYNTQRLILDTWQRLTNAVDLRPLLVAFLRLPAELSLTFLQVQLRKLSHV